MNICCRATFKIVLCSLMRLKTLGLFRLDREELSSIFFPYLSFNKSNCQDSACLAIRANNRRHLILHIPYNSIHTTSILSSPFYMHTSFLTCLCISSYSSAQALTVSSNITPTCVKNTLVKMLETRSSIILPCCTDTSYLY